MLRAWDSECCDWGVLLLEVQELVCQVLGSGLWFSDPPNKERPKVVRQDYPFELHSPGRMKADKGPLKTTVLLKGATYMGFHVNLRRATVSFMGIL